MTFTPFADNEAITAEMFNSRLNEFLANPSLVMGQYLKTPYLIDFVPMSVAGPSFTTYSITNGKSFNIEQIGNDGLAPVGITAFGIHGNGDLGAGTDAFIDANDRGVTLAAWFKFDNAASPVERLFDTSFTFEGFPTTYDLLWLTRNANEGLTLTVKDTNPTTYTLSSPDSLLADTAWHFVGVRLNTASQEASFVVDGVEYTGGAIGADIATTDTVAVGQVPPASTEPLSAKVSLFIAGRGDVGAAWLKKLYNSSKPLFGG